MLLGSLLMVTSACTGEVMGMLVPAPNTKPTSGEIPNGDPFNPDDPNPPVPPVDPLDEIVNNPARLARIGQTPIIEIYYTEYTKDYLFPSLEEVRNFTHIIIGRGCGCFKENHFWILIFCVQ